MLSTPPLCGHNYLRENAITNCASTAAPGNQIQAAQSDARTDPGPSDAGGEQEQQHDSPLVLPGLSSSSSDVLTRKRNTKQASEHHYALLQIAVKHKHNPK